MHPFVPTILYVLTTALNPWNTHSIAGIIWDEPVLAQPQFVLSATTVYVCMQKVGVLSTCGLQVVLLGMS